MTTIVEDHGYPLISIGGAPMSSEPEPLSAKEERALRLTGAMLDEIAALWPESNAASFAAVDYDEFEAFVPLDAARQAQERDALAATIMAALNEHGQSYRLPRDPSDLAHLVADAVLGEGGASS